MDGPTHAPIMSSAGNEAIEDGSCLNKRYQRRYSNHLALPKGLCGRCRSIDWSLLGVLQPSHDATQHRLLNLGTYSALVSSECPLCRLFVRAVMSNIDVTAQILEIWPAYQVLTPHLDGEGVRKRASVLEIKHSKSHDRTGTLGVKHPGAALDDFAPRLIMPDQIDYGVVLEWLKTCQDLHPDCRVQNRACNLPGFKVIDCTTNTVVVAPERCSYVALSYVWGAAPAQMGSGWPLVISDRILVALSLGLHYLWVDRYCIDQEETPEKQAQISQMDRIYNDSQITIVAAAGDGPQYGLPGVSARSRKQQQALEIDGITLAQVFHRTPRALEAATWTTRGWTYQEGFLSRRRLIFTDHQVSFVCNTMYCAESIRHTPKAYTTGLATMHFHHLIPGAISHAPMMVAVAGGWPDLMRYAEEYSKRRLSYDSDALNAILGIFTSVGRTNSVVHLWGVPARLQPVNSTIYQTEEEKTAFISLSWVHESPARRREAFPSWSWVGWDGIVDFWPPGVLVPFECSINVIESSVKSLPLSTYIENALHRSSVDHYDAPRILKITAPVLELSYAWKSWDKSQVTDERNMRDGIHAVAPVVPGVNRLLFVRLDEPSIRLDELTDCKLVVLSHRRDHLSSLLLLVRPVKNKFMRIGIVEEPGRGHGWPYAPFVDELGSIIDDLDVNLDGRLWLQECRQQVILLE